MPRNKKIKKVLVIGSGPIVIGQAAEFDYAGAQACRVLKSEGIKVVLINSNPATIMTDKALADEIYLEPLTLATVKRICEKTRPDGILASLGGQTGLTMAMQLYKEGYLAEKGIALLGTDAEAIIKAEDRDLFKQTMLEIGQPVIPSDIASEVDKALEIAEKIGYPVIVRPAFTLGGCGGGVAYDKETLADIAFTGLEQSPIRQILVEKYIYGWKEIEFEAIRDSKGTSIAVCSMENVDPVGVHTGDSIVVAPALTLSGKEYAMLREASLAIINALGIEGGCNCQFALDPESMEYAVIEVNPRVSRSSALASKATGYPIAKVNTRIALGYTLDEIKNEVTGKTYACSEPTVDYVVVKMPRWPFDKFVHADRTLGTQMKATGEVMSIGDSFEAALMKAVRGVENGTDTLNVPLPRADMRFLLSKADDRRIYTVFGALKAGYGVDFVHEVTMIDELFLSKLLSLAEYEKSIENNLTEELYVKGKKLGYTDASLEKLSKCKVPFRMPCAYRMVDTCAAEYEAVTPYFYSVYGSDSEVGAFLDEKKQNVLVLGSGPIRIGQGIEFDYSSVHCVWALKEKGYSVAIINNNPETVSTDFDVADRLYFEPLTPEDVKHVIDVEKPVGVVVAFGGQTAIKLTKFVDSLGIPVLGTSADGIDTAEDRERFDKLLATLNVKRPEGVTVFTKEEAVARSAELGYPVLVRPSYVIGGQNMTIAFKPEDVAEYMDIILASKIDNPVLIDRYLSGIELEVDVISDGKEVLIPGIMEHVERAGIHSGDSIAVYPSFNLNDVMQEKIVDTSTSLALALQTKGLVNIQYLIYENELYVIEVNPRASRTIPYISKVTGLPLVEIATDVMLGKTLADIGVKGGLYPKSPYFAVKVPVFSFEKLSDVNSLLGPEMKSTGEVLGIGKTLEEALFKGLLAASFRLPSHAESGIYFSVADKDKPDAVKIAKKFYDLGMVIYATPGTAKELASLGNDIITVDNLSEGKDIYSYLESGKIQYIVNTCPSLRKMVEEHNRLRRKALRMNIACLTSLDTAEALADMLAGGYNEYNTELVDLNGLRKEKLSIKFSKMHSLGNDYIYINNLKGNITCPESLAVILCNRHKSIGGDGLVLIEKSSVADAKMRIFNKDGSEGKMAGNSIRCVAKYLYDNGISKKTEINVETASGIKNLKLFLTDGKVSSVTVDMGEVSLTPSSLPALVEGDSAIDRVLNVGGNDYNVTLVSVGNPHAVLFVDRVDNADVEGIGKAFEHSPLFPERINTEFIRVVNRTTLKMRVWERGNGETLACGTGACAAAVAAVLNGFCPVNEQITVRVRGGDLLVCFDGKKVSLTGSAELSFEGIVKI